MNSCKGLTPASWPPDQTLHLLYIFRLLSEVLIVFPMTNLQRIWRRHNNRLNNDAGKRFRCYLTGQLLRPQQYLEKKQKFTNMMDHNNNNKTKERGLVSRALRRDDSGCPLKIKTRMMMRPQMLERVGHNMALAGHLKQNVSDTIWPLKAFMVQGLSGGFLQISFSTCQFTFII